jgi:alpha-1,6-mannosyltransferase
VIALSVILALSYPMLSSDVFKYLFSAKEILVYHANPYTVTPNSFPDDTWIRFMRWVHTTSPYGPFFTLLTIPYYLLGFGKFVPILYLFKLDQVAWYLLAIWLIGKMKGVKAQYYFAFNPLILMEWLVNAHNDAIMITLLLLSIYLYTIKNKAWSFVTLLLSIGVKYVTVIFLPFIFISKKIKLDYIVYFLLACLFSAPLLYHYSWQYQPWYVTWLVPLASLVDSK